MRGRPQVLLIVVVCGLAGFPDNGVGALRSNRGSPAVPGSAQQHFRELRAPEHPAAIESAVHVAAVHVAAIGHPKTISASALVSGSDADHAHVAAIADGAISGLKRHLDTPAAVSSEPKRPVKGPVKELKAHEGAREGVHELLAPEHNLIPAGHTGDESGSSYLCPSGKYSKENEKRCTDCPKGAWSDVGSGSCTKCKAGTYNEKEGQEGCTPCGQGFFSTVVGASDSTTCRACPEGSICLAQSNPTPQPCAIGVHAQAAAAGCGKKCPIMFQANAGQQSCTPKPVLLVLGCAVVLMVVVFGALFAQHTVVKRAKATEGALSFTYSPASTVLDYGTI